MYEIFAKLLAEKGLKAADVSRATGVSSTVFSEWKKGKSSPKADKLQLIADFFNVSLGYLYSGIGDKEMEEIENIVSAEIDLKKLISHNYGCCENEEVEGKYGSTVFYLIGEDKKFAISEDVFDKLFYEVTSLINKCIEENKKDADTTRQECLKVANTPPPKPIYNMMRQRGLIIPDLEEKYGYTIRESKIIELPGKDHLKLNAARPLKGATEENKKHDDEIMDDPNF